MSTRQAEEDYGRPIPGSKSEARGKNAADWVEQEVLKLVQEIERIGKVGPKNSAQVQITFGELFVHYQDVSDTLVGMLMRAQKRGIVQYEGHGGGLLLQGKHNHVVITLDRKRAKQFQSEFESKRGAAEAEAAAAPASKSAVAAMFATKPAPQQRAVVTASSKSKPAPAAATTAVKQPQNTRAKGNAIFLAIAAAALVLVFIVSWLFIKRLFR